jgi:hypothetical protein
MIDQPQGEAGGAVAQEAQVEMYMSGRQFSREEAQQVIKGHIAAKLPEILSYPPLREGLGNPGVELGLNEFLPVQQFIDAAFTLAPANPEPPYKDKAPVALAELKLSREVAVMERSDFVPAVLGDFEGISQNSTVPSATMLAGLMVKQQKWEAQQNWFDIAPEGSTAANGRGVVARTGFKKESNQ